MQQEYHTDSDGIKLSKRRGYERLLSNGKDTSGRLGLGNQAKRDSTVSTKAMGNCLLYIIVPMILITDSIKFNSFQPVLFRLCGNMLHRASLEVDYCRNNQR